MERVVVKFVQTESPYRRQQAPVRVFDPIAKKFVETGQTSGKRKPSNVSETLRFVPSQKTSRYVTGLEELIPNHLKDSSVLEIRGRYGLSDKWQPLLEEIVKQDTIMRQRYYEILDGVDPDVYTPIIPLSIRNTEHGIVRMRDAQDKTKIERFEITLYEGANVFSSDTSRGRLAIQLVKNHPEVAKTRDAVNRDLHRFYIAEVDEEVIDRIGMDNLENEAVAALLDLHRNNEPAKLYQIAVMLDLVRGAVSANTVYDQLNRFIKNKVASNDRGSKREKIQQFLDVVEMLKKNYKLFLSTYMAAQAYNVNLLYIESGRLIWKSQRDNPARASWKSKEALAAYLAQEMDNYDPSPKKKGDAIPSDNGFAIMREELKNVGINIDMQ